NNPTGRLISAVLFHAVLEAAPDAVVCVDEAYYEISGHTLAADIRAAPNAVLVRTFSKGYGLAGARVGYLVGPLEITRTIESVRLPQNMTAFGVAAACRALADQEGLAQRVHAIVAERTRLDSELQRRGWQTVPSHGNFVLARPPRPAVDVSEWLQRGGLIVRSYGGDKSPDEWFGPSVGPPQGGGRRPRRAGEQPERRPP